MIRKSLVYLLIMLLPMQAVAMSCFSVYKNTTVATHAPSAQVDHCANMGAPASVDNPVSHHKSPTCWFGSVCLVQVAVFAVPTPHTLLSMKREAPTYPAVTIHYRSVNLGNPQRPPAALQY